MDACESEDGGSAFYNATTRECISREGCPFFRIEDPQFPARRACLPDCTYFMETNDEMAQCFDETGCPGFYIDADRKRVECLENADSCEFVSIREYKKCISACEYPPVIVDGVRYCPDCGHITSFTFNMSGGEIAGLEYATCTTGISCNDSLKIRTRTCANLPTCTLNQQLFAQSSDEAANLWNLNGECVAKCRENDNRYENQCLEECPEGTAAYQQTCVAACPKNMVAKDRICVKQKLTKNAKIGIILGTIIATLLVAAGVTIGIRYCRRKKL